MFCLSCLAFSCVCFFFFFFFFIEYQMLWRHLFCKNKPYFCWTFFSQIDKTNSPNFEMSSLLLKNLATNINMFLIFLTWKSRESLVKKSWFKSYKMFFKLSVKVLRIRILFQKMLNCTLFSCIWVAFWPKSLPKPTIGDLTELPHTP